MTLRLPLKIVVSPITADGILEPSHLLTSFVFPYFHNFVMRGVLIMWAGRGTPFTLLNLK